MSLELEKPSNTSQFMKSPKHLVLRSRCHVQCSIRSRVVIRHHRSLVSGRRQPGQHDLTETLLTLSDDPTLLTLDSIHMARLERWTVVMYSKSSGCSRVNDVRRQLFTHGTRTLDHIPHTGSAASTCKASSVPGRLHLETSKAATPRCPGCFSVGLDARREHETLGAILDCSRRRQQSVCSPPPLWMWKGVQRKLQMCQSRNQSSALFCVTVKAGASTTMECKLCDATNTDICV